MNQSLLKLLAFVAFFTCITMDLHAQSLKQVRQAVGAFFESDDESAVAKQQLSDWGNDALVHLKTLAAGTNDIRMGSYVEDAWSIVCAADTIGTIEAMEFLVDILDGQTGIDATHALLVMGKFVSAPFSNSKPYRYVQKHPRFRPAMRRFAETGSWLEKGQAAEIAASLDWEDFEPLIRNMLNDPNVSLRQTAAKALSKLTGRAVEPELPSASFPDRKLIANLLGKPKLAAVEFDSPIIRSFLLGRGDDPPTLMIGNGTKFEPLLGRTGSEPTLDFGVSAITVDVLDITDSPRQLISLSSTSGFGGAGADLAISSNEAGEELWRYEPPRSGLETFAILYGDEGPYGVAFGPGGGDQGIVALDERGNELWTAPAIVLYEIRTHADLPGVLLFVGGEHNLLTHSPSGLQQSSLHATDDYLYSSIGVLYPGRDGSPEMAIAGSGANSTPTLIGQDAKGRRLWTATLPHSVAALQVLEVAGRERLLAVATDGGALFVLNMTGTLLWKGEIPKTGEEDRVIVFGLLAGNTGNGRAVIGVSTLGGYFYFPIDVDAIPRTR